MANVCYEVLGNLNHYKLFLFNTGHIFFFPSVLTCEVFHFHKGIICRLGVSAILFSHGRYLEHAL